MQNSDHFILTCALVKYKPFPLPFILPGQVTHKPSATVISSKLIPAAIPASEIKTYQETLSHRSSRFHICTASMKEGSQRPQLTAALLTTRLSGTCWHAIRGVSFPSHPSSPSTSISHHLSHWQGNTVYTQTFYKAKLDKMIRSSTCSSSYMFGGCWLAGGCSFSAPRLLCSGIDVRGGTDWRQRWKRRRGPHFLTYQTLCGSVVASFYISK